MYTILKHIQSVYIINKTLPTLENKTKYYSDIIKNNLSQYVNLLNSYLVSTTVNAS